MNHVLNLSFMTAKNYLSKIIKKKKILNFSCHGLMAHMAQKES